MVAGVPRSESHGCLLGNSLRKAVAGSSTASATSAETVLAGEVCASHWRTACPTLGAMQSHHPSDHRRLFLDFETTGLDPAADHVIEVGLRGSASLDRLVSDAPPASNAALRVHGLDPVLCQVRGRPSRQVLNELLEGLGGEPVEIVAHNADFERGFLEAWAARQGRSLPEIRWTCTWTWARRLVGKPPFRLRLGDLAGIFGWKTGALHRAGDDAALAQRLWETLQAWEGIQRRIGSSQRMIYVAGPLRGDGRPESIAHNQEAMRNLCRWIQALLPDAVLVVPHLNFAFLDESGPGGLEVRRRALRACETMVARCDALLLCGGPTEGMLREREIALACGLPVLEAPGWDAPRKPDGALPYPMVLEAPFRPAAACSA